MTETFNLAAALLDPRDGARPAFRVEGRAITYAEVTRLVARAANGLRAQGVRPGDRVALVLPDSLAFVATFLGAIRIGAIAVTLSTYLSPDEYAYLLEDSGARLRVDEAAFTQLVQGQPETTETHATRPEDPAFIQYSSGTTGKPKGVVHMHKNGVQPAKLHGRHISQVTADDVVFSVPRQFFSFGLNNSLLVPLYYGACAILEAARPTAQRALEIIARERPTLFYNVPTGYAGMLAAADSRSEADLSSVRRCVSAGEALPAPVFERWKARFGQEILDGIGSTEIGHICISNFPGRVRPGTSGQVIPGYEARIANESGADAPDGEVGDLLVRGPSTSREYWRQPEATAHTFRDGWVFTGDRYIRDADGYFTHQGRSDDMLRVSGMWVSPMEVESTLLRHQSVRECAVVARRNADGLDRVAAYVVAPGADASALSMALRELAADALPSYKRPQWIEIVPELPKTSTGKVQRYKLRAR